MKKIKLLFVSLSVFTAVSGAITVKLTNPCEYLPQYLYAGGTTYIPAGQLGVDYLCWSDVGICTYARNNIFSDFYPCQTGYYFKLNP
ncbi:hypothetical protein [Paraflavitalea speifideaquila]|uniref:hypothetical protein n=1 Tax=Paraflavitalea speifideaquila TaxID=3076558 RepID=UPI0028E7C34D|nr:hypothetical protein [Paraflavitalea speifideiaquila]